MAKTLAQLQKGMPADVKAKHDAMTREQALEEARKLRDHFDQIDFAGGVCSAEERERQRYFELLAASKQ